MFVYTERFSTDYLGTRYVLSTGKHVQTNDVPLSMYKLNKIKLRKVRIICDVEDWGIVSLAPPPQPPQWIDFPAEPMRQTNSGKIGKEQADINLMAW